MPPASEPVAHVAQPGRVEERPSSSAGGEAPHGGRQVRYAVVAAVDDAADGGHEPVEPDAVEGRRAAGAPAGVISRQTTRPPGRTTRASSRKPALEVGAGCARRRRRWRPRTRRRRPAASSASPRHAARSARRQPRRLLAGALEHVLGEVDAGHLRRRADPARQLEREVAGAAADVEHVGARPTPASSAASARQRRSRPAVITRFIRSYGPGDAVEHHPRRARAAARPARARRRVTRAPPLQELAAPRRRRSSTLPATKSIASCSVSGCV